MRRRVGQGLRAEQGRDVPGFAGSLRVIDPDPGVVRAEGSSV